MLWHDPGVGGLQPLSLEQAVVGELLHTWKQVVATCCQAGVKFPVWKPLPTPGVEMRPL